MNIRIIETPITRAEAKEIAKEFYIDMVKGVVDVEREIIALGGEWHIDANRASRGWFAVGCGLGFQLLSR